MAVRRGKRKAAENEALKFADSLFDKFALLKGLDEYISSATADEDLVYGLLDSTLVQDVSLMGLKLCPNLPDDASVSRGPNGNIIGIKFKDGSGFTGDNLIRLLGAWQYARSGAIGLVWYTDQSSEKRALILAATNQSSAERTINTKEGELKIKYTNVYHSKNTVNVHADPTLFLRDICSFSGVGVEDLKKLFKAYDNIIAVDADYVHQQVTTLQEIRIKREQNNGRFTDALYAILETCLLRSASLDEKFSAFCQDPSLTFLTSLNLPKPYVASNLVDSDDKSVHKVKLSNLADDAQILLTEYSLDANFYKKTTLEDFEIYPYGNYFVKKKKVKTKLDKVSAWNAKAYKDVVRAIQSERDATKSHQKDVVSPPVSDIDLDQSVEF